MTARIQPVCTSAILLGLFFVGQSSVAQQVLRDPLDNALGTNLHVISTGDTTSGTLALDNNAEVMFAYDYANSSVGADGCMVDGFPCAAAIPEAPNFQAGDAPRTGLFLAANVASGVVSEISGLVNDPNNLTQLLNMSGTYSVQVDIWMNIENAAGFPGTTEMGGLFVGHDGSTPGRSGAGFVYTGDGDAAQDYRMYKDAQHQFVASGQYNPDMVTAWQNDADYVGADAIDDRATQHRNDFFEIAFPAFDIGFALEPDDRQGEDQVLEIYPDDDDNPANGGGGGNGGFQWMTLVADVDGTAGQTTFSLTSAASGNTVEIGTLDTNIGNAVSMSGAVGLYYGDLFSSLNQSGYQFGIFDNLIITQETPAGVPGDYNGDNVVNAADYTVWKDNEGAIGVPGMVPGDGTSLLLDGVPDGMVTREDYDFWVENFGNTMGSGLGSEAVPEPSALLLMLLAACGLAVARR